MTLEIQIHKQKNTHDKTYVIVQIYFEIFTN